MELRLTGFKKTAQSVEDTQIVIKVFDHKLISTLIGTTSLSIAEVYRADDHVVRHKWMCLSNIEIDYQRIMGYLKLSCNVTRGENARQPLEDEPLDLNSNSNRVQNLSIPPKFKPKQMQINVNVHEADRLVGLDGSFFGGAATSDPYIKATFGADVVQTSVKSNVERRAVFREVLVISTIYPSLVSSFTLSLLDHDSFKSDDVFGSLSIRIPDVTKEMYKDGYWIYFYGAHDFAPNSEAKEKMNEFPELASAFKGAVYVVIELEELKGKFGCYCRKISRGEFLVPPKKKLFRVRIELYSVQQVLYNDKDYNKHPHKLVVNWGGNVKETRSLKIENGIMPIYSYLEIKELFATESLEETPDIIISLVDVKKNYFVSFCRLRPEDFSIEEKIKDRYLMLNVDKSFTNDLRDDTAGILHMKIGTDANQNQMQEFEEIPLFRQKFPSLDKKAVVLIINVIQAKSLPSADDDGAADPYVKISHYGNQARSNIINDTLNPIWNERVFLRSYVVGDFFSPVIISVYDHDKTEEDEFLGSTSIFLNEFDLSKNVAYMPKPHWYNLRYTKKLVIGKIKLSVSIVDERNDAFYPELKGKGSAMKRKTKPDIPKEPLAISQKVEDCHLKLRILGMRNLKTDGMSSIGKPFVVMEIPDYKFDKKTGQHTFTRTKTEVKSLTGGENPNIGQILK